MGDWSDVIKDVFLIDVVLLFLGIEIVGGVMMNLIDRNSWILCKISKIFIMYLDN